jgi:CRP-like cAMP-binding protein
MDWAGLPVLGGIMSDNFQPAVVKFARDSYILVEGKPNADKFYIIREGKVHVSRAAETAKEGSVAGSGEMIGLVSAMAAHGYIESAQAMTDVTLLAIERKQYGDVVRKSPTLAINTIRQFSQRMRSLDEAVSRRALKSTAANDPSHLYQIGEFYEKAGRNNQALYSYQQYLAYNPNAENAVQVRKKIEKIQPQITAARPVYTPDTMVQKYPKGNLLFAEGESGHNLYIIQSGSVKITKIVNNQEVVLAVLNKGDIFGEMAMLEDKPRAATAEIYEDSTLMAVNQANFTELINIQPDMVVKMATLMSERIWHLYRQLANTLIENPLGRIYDALIIQLEKNRIDLTSKEEYLCSFGFKELAGMAGISESESKELSGKIFSARKIILKNDKILVDNVAEVFKEAEYYRKAEKLARQRMESKKAQSTG